MRDWWKQVVIADLCRIKSGKGVSVGEIFDEYCPGAFPCYGGNGRRGFIRKYSHDGVFPIIGRVGALCGNVHLAEGKFYATEHALVCGIITDINAEFLCYLFLNMNLRQYAVGAAQPVLSAGFISSLPVSIPPLPEQQRIVDILDQEFAKIDALKANAEKSLQAAKDLFQATLKKELEPKEGWKKYCLKDICTDYGDYGMSLPSKLFDGVRYLRITDITEWGDLNDDKVSVEAEEIEERYMVREGDILFARTGATVGKTLVYEERFGPCCYAGYLIRYRPDQSIVSPRMLYYITHSASYYDWVATSQKSATLPNISAKLYNSYELTLPAVKEQEQIVALLDDLNNKSKSLQDNYQKTLTLCDDLKQSLLRKAFNGEL